MVEGRVSGEFFNMTGVGHDWNKYLPGGGGLNYFVFKKRGAHWLN